MIFSFRFSLLFFLWRNFFHKIFPSRRNFITLRLIFRSSLGESSNTATAKYFLRFSIPPSHGWHVDSVVAAASRSSWNLANTKNSQKRVFNVMQIEWSSKLFFSSAAVAKPILAAFKCHCNSGHLIMHRRWSDDCRFSAASAKRPKKKTSDYKQLFICIKCPWNFGLARMAEERNIKWNLINSVAEWQQQKNWEKCPESKNSSCGQGRPMLTWARCRCWSPFPPPRRLIPEIQFHSLRRYARWGDIRSHRKTSFPLICKFSTQRHTQEEQKKLFFPSLFCGFFYLQ